MRITSGGDVLMTTTSGNKLATIKGQTGNGYYGELKLGNADHSAGIIGRHISLGKTDLEFYTENYYGDGYAKRMTIDSDGNVGIGVNASDYWANASNLVVGGLGAVSGITIATNGNLTGSLIFADGTGGGDNTRGGLQYDHSTNNMLFRVNNDTQMRIDSNGNVGIGTISPSRELDIQASSGWAEIALRGNTGGGGSLEFWTNTTKRAEIFADTEDIVFRNTASNTERMRIESGGNVGIGTTTPYSRLDINGVLSIGPASEDPNFTVTSTDVSTIAGGSIELVQGFGGTTTSGDTIVFTYEAQSWKAFQYEYCISAAYGLSKGGGGGYNNNGMSSYYYVTTNQGSNVNVTSVVSNSGGSSGQYVVVTITGVFGIHPCVSFKYTQSGGDGAPRADRATLAFNS